MDTLTAKTATTVPSTHTPAPRVDLYAGIHKALRHFMNDTLGRLGWLDVGDEAEVRAALAQFETLMATMLSHLHHENRFIHTAIEARRAGGARVTADAHEEHLASIEQLRAEATALAQTPADRRQPIARRLYQHLALFIAENLQHMHVEETLNNAALWALYSDAELMALHDRLVADVEPTTMVELTRWFSQALAPQELAGMLAGMRDKMPPEAFVATRELVRSFVDEARWAKASAALAAA